MISRFIANELRLHLQKVNVIERYAGLVKTVERRERVDQSWKVQRFPAALDVNDWLPANKADYFPCIPDGRFSGLSFFEDQGATCTGRDNRGMHFTAKIRLIVWYNQEKTTFDSAFIQAAVLFAIPESLNCGLLNRVGVSIAALPDINTNIFSKYTFDEKQNQFLMYPYTAFGVDALIKYTINEHMLKNPELMAQFDQSFNLSFTS